MTAAAIPLRSWYFADPARLEPLKWLAVLAMVCDHLAITVVHGQPWLREIGAFAFPVFFLAFGVGLAATSDPLAVARRLLAPSLVAQVAWQVIDPGHSINVLAVCASAALSLAVWRQFAGNPKRWLALVLPLLLVVLRCEGGFMAYALLLGGFLAARGSMWPMSLAAGAWLAALPSVGFVVGVASVVLMPRSSLVVPRVRGLLSWVYAGHLVLLASLVLLGVSL